MGKTCVSSTNTYIRSGGLRDHLDSRGIKHAWLAKRMGWSRTKMHFVLTGVSRVQPAAADQICELLDAPFSLLFELTEEPYRRTTDNAA